jgi:hypothetical protein
MRHIGSRPMLSHQGPPLPSGPFLNLLSPLWTLLQTMAKVYVGNLPLDTRVRDIEDLFWKYGRIRDIDLKTPARPPAFAFVTFESHMDAEDAVRGRGKTRPAPPPLFGKGSECRLRPWIHLA